MVVGKDDDEVKSSMGNMPSLLHEEDEDLPSSSVSPPPHHPASGQNTSQSDGTPINSQVIEKFEAESVDDASNTKSETGEELHQQEGGEQTLRAAELPVAIESPLPAEGDKEEGNESEEVGKEHQQPDCGDEASELRVPSVSVFCVVREDDGKNDCAEKMEEDGGDEGKLDDSHVVNEVDDSRLNEDEGMKDGVEVEGAEDAQKIEESSKEPNLDSAVEQKEEIEKQNDTSDEIDTDSDKGDEAGADMEDENDDNRDEVEDVMENVNDNNRGEVEADMTHEKDECLDVAQIDEKDECLDVAQIDEKCECVAVSMLVSESESHKKDGYVNAPALDAMTGVGTLENIGEVEKDGALAGSGLASISDVVREEEKDEVMNVIELVSDNSAVAHKSEAIKSKENDTSVSAPVMYDSVLVREFADTNKEEKDDSTPVNESKVDEDKDEDMSAQASELPRSDPEPEKLEVGGESEQVIVKDDFDNDEMEEEEGEGTPFVNKGMNIEAEAAGGSSSGKRKRGRGAGAVGRASTKKKIEEDVCFICFDGGDLVLCDRRGCPKAYHSSCVNRDEAFFQTKGRWNCGWHLCSICEKNAYFMCYTCTFSLCKGCVKNSVFYSISGNKGFCETCMKMVLLIENNEEANKEAQVDFSDKNSWEFLFKDYWLDMKGNLQLSSQEIAQAKSLGKISEVITSKQVLTDENNGSDSVTVKVSTSQKSKYKKRSKSLTKDEDSQSDSDNSPNISGSRHKTRKTKKQLKSFVKEWDSPSTASVVSAEWMSSHGNSEWASKELLEFVMHMKDGDPSVVSQFDVLALLLEYIKRNKLRDPRRKSQIICDSRLQNLFGKPRVGHFEMLKLLESHFLTKEESQAVDFQGSNVDNEENVLDTEENTEAHVMNKDKRWKTRKKGNERGLRSNAEDYAAIDNHNIGLIFLRRNLVEALLENIENFQEKVMGSFVRIRISGAGQKQDMYRLVQVVGTSKADEPYKVGKRTTDFMLEIQNLDKTESISIDIISNQEFTEDECKRLRQSIKFGLINRMTVGDIQEKAMELQVVRVNDWLEAETVRLSHLCDRASETGRRKDLRECVEKLQLLKTPEERQRRLEEFPKVRADPKMDPSYESEDDADQTDNKKPDNSLRPRGSGFSRRGRDPLSPRKEGTISSESWSGTKSYASTSRELTRNLSIGSSATRREDTNMPSESNESLISRGRNRPSQQLTSWERQRTAPSSEMVVSENPPATPSTINETEKMWHYKDPSGKVQGPFSMAQLRKWSGSGYFPSDLKIWKSTEKEDDSVLLTDALIGKFQQVLNKNVANVQMPPTASLSASSTGSLQKSEGASQTAGPVLSVNVPKTATNGWGSDSSARNDSVNLPSPTPGSARMGGISGQATELLPISSTKLSLGADGSLAAYNQKTNAYRNDTHDSFSGVNVISRQEMGIGPSSTQLFHSQTNSSGGLHVAQATPAQQTDLSSSMSLPTLVHLQQPSLNTSGSHSWGSTPSNQMTLPVQQQTYGQWSSQSGTFPNPGLSGSTPINQINMQPSAAQSLSWGQLPGNPNMGWGASVPGYTHTSSQHSGGQGPTPGNPDWVRSGGVNPGWVTAAQGQAPGNVNSGLVSANQTPVGNVWPMLGQGSASGSASQGRVVPSGSQATWGNEQNHNGSRYSQGGLDSGSGGHKPWNRQSSFGLKVCNYYLSGHCKKGSACDYMHPQQ